MAMFSNSYKARSVTPNFEIVFIHVLNNFEKTNEKSWETDNARGNKTQEALGLKEYMTFSPTSNQFSGKNVQSYTFTQSTRDITGSFSITIKEDIKEPDINKNEKFFLDEVEELDLVKIIENGVVEFWGIVRTISFGATAGAFNKAITVSGTSAAELLNMFKINTDMTLMSFFQGDEGNTEIANKIVTLFMKPPVEITEVFRVMYNYIVDLAKTKKGSKIISYKAQRIFRFIFGVSHDDYGVEFLDCNEEIKYPMAANIFNESETTLISYFKLILPDNFYEFFHRFTRKDNKPVITIRQMPFSADTWNKLHITTLDPSLITDYTLTKTDTNIFTCFYAFAQNGSMASEYFKRLTTDGKSPVIIDDDLLSIYGYIPLEVSINGYTENGSNDLQKTTEELSKLLADWYKDLRHMYSGDVTIVNTMEVDSKTKQSVNPRIGERVKLCGGEFYVTQSTHTWRYGDSAKINLKIERGGVYKDGKFQYDANNKLSISRAYAELLTKE